MYNRFLFCIFPFLGLSACYLEGSSCSGPLCFSVATEFGNNECVAENCDALFRCPDADSVRNNSLILLNQIRQSVVPNSCGGNINTGSQPASVVWNETLFSVADRHARDMAANNFVASLGSDGVSVVTNVAAQDSTLSNVSQLVAGGFANTGALVNEWLTQPEECGKLLDVEVTQYAIACRFDGNSDFGTYWSLILADEEDSDQ